MLWVKNFTPLNEWVEANVKRLGEIRDGCDDLITGDGRDPRWWCNQIIEDGTDGREWIQVHCLAGPLYWGSVEGINDGRQGVPGN